jgi:hypothetical protein
MRTAGCIPIAIERQRSLSNRSSDPGRSVVQCGRSSRPASAATDRPRYPSPLPCCCEPTASASLAALGSSASENGEAVTRDIAYRLYDLRKLNKSPLQKMRYFAPALSSIGFENGR